MPVALLAQADHFAVHSVERASLSAVVFTETCGEVTST